MSDTVYIEIPAPAKQKICTRVSCGRSCSGSACGACTRVSCERPCSGSACGACTRQDWKDYGPQIGIVAAVFLAAFVGLIIILVRNN